MKNGILKRFLWLIVPAIGVFFSVISSIKSIYKTLNTYLYSVKKKVFLCLVIYVICCIPIPIATSIFSIGFMQQTIKFTPLIFLLILIAMHLSGLLLAISSVMINKKVYQKNEIREFNEKPVSHESNETVVANETNEANETDTVNEASEISETNYPNSSIIKSNLKFLLIPIVGAYIAGIRALIDILSKTGIETANPQKKLFIAIKYLALTLPHGLVVGLIDVGGLTIPFAIAYLITLYGCVGIYVLLQISWTKKWNKSVPLEKRFRIFK